MSLLTKRLMPTPLGFKYLFASNVLNGSKSFSWSCWLMPGPESYTTTDSSVLKLWLWLRLCSFKLTEEKVISTVDPDGL